MPNAPCPYASSPRRCQPVQRFLPARAQFKLARLANCACNAFSIWRWGAASLKLMKTNNRACVVTDVQLPDMSGLDLVRRLIDFGLSRPRAPSRLFTDVSGAWTSCRVVTSMENASSGGEAMIAYGIRKIAPHTQKSRIALDQSGKLDVCDK
jgi:DNA-binding NarL/FixJ family response regulator